MNLTDFTQPRMFLPAMQASTPPTAIRELAGVMGAEGVLPDVEGFVQAALDREQLTSTDLEPCWAIPHARIKGLVQPWFALGRVSTPIHWGKIPVSLIMLLAAPEPDTQGWYLRLIALFARLNRKTDLTDRLSKVAGGFEMFEAVRGAGTPEVGVVL